MSLRDDDNQDQLTGALQKTTLSNTPDDQNTINAKAGSSTADTQTDSAQSSDEQETNSHDKDKDSNEHRGEVSSNKEPSSIAFVTSPEAASDSKDSGQTTELTRRKSSLSTTGSRLRRAASAEKHVTIVDAPIDTAGGEGTKGQAEQTSEVKAQEDKDDKATKEELAKILMQFDPLAESKQKKVEDDTVVTIVDRGMPSNDTLLNPETIAFSPNLSLSSSSSSSPKTPQQLDSPRTSHDVQVAMTERAKSSSSKKKSESRQKGSTSSGKSKTSEKAQSGNNTANNSTSEPPKPKDIPFDFHKFLEQMRHRSAMPITRYFQSTFSPSTTDDAERDEVLSQKIRIFRWIREEHLDIPLSPHNEAYLNNAQIELKKINSYKAPRDKVICILNCCKFIFSEFFVYISRFRNPDKLQAEAGYYLASLMGAISFIENLEASSLSISPEEFDQQIGKTMTELNQEKLEAITASEGADRAVSPESSTSSHRKQESKLATLVAGTAATRSNRQRPPINEKQYLAAESVYQEKTSLKSSPSSTGTSILNPVAFIERGANFATKTIRKPLDLVEKMFQDNGDNEEMAKPYPPRVPQQQQNAGPPPLPNRNNQQHLQGASNPGRNDSFTEFVYVPTGQQIQQPSPQQPNANYLLQHQQGYPDSHQNAEQAAQQQQQPRQQQSMEQYLQALETLTDMFPSCERQVCDVILQANDGRLSPSIDALLGNPLG
ncbi:hypothetical protein BGX27_009173 [Mortierella sp. AM989]|nr:hypothetical protein BGX27_009173 [Mortierella sp. AM989]